MKVLTGTDIIEVNRIKEKIEKNENQFLDKIFTEEEKLYCESKKVLKFQSYAARFAAKEAIYKALSPYVPASYGWKDFEICKNENGRPYVKLGFEVKNLKSIDLSMSHLNEYAVAMCSVLIEE